MALLTYKAALSRLFPRDDESSHWMLRLAMIRQDLKLEVSQIALSENATRDDLFRTTYFLRRISISILEAESVMARDLGRLLKRGRMEMPPSMSAALIEFRRTLTEARPALEEIRDVIGAHHRPKYDATENPTVITEVLGTHGAWELVVDVDSDTGEQTNLADVGLMSFLFAWPDVKNAGDLERRHGAYSEVMLRSAGGVMHATDALLYAYWKDLGIKPEVAK